LNRRELTKLIKAKVLKYFRYKRRCIVSTEVLYYNSYIADVLALFEDDTFCEIEVKVDKSDLNEDLNKGRKVWHKLQGFKVVENVKGKHDLFEDVNCSSLLPNYFYYCVPLEMVDYTLKFIDDVNSKYGLLAYNPIKNEIESVKKAIKIHDEKSKSLRKNLIARVSSELVFMYDLIYGKKKV
jgi:hypothetical protein